MRANFSKAVFAGVVGTLAMTAVGIWVAPMMGIPKMNPAAMLSTKMGDMIVLGWIGHLMIGVMLAIFYAVVAAPKLPGPPVARGAVFSVVPWLMAQLLVMPMMGMPIFSGSMTMAMGSLVGHLVYGMVVGGIVGGQSPALS